MTGTGFDEGGFLLPGEIRRNLMASAAESLMLGPVEKVATVIPMPAELLADVTPLRNYVGNPPTEEEQAAHRARNTAADAAVVEAYERLLGAAAGDELALDVLHLHRPDGVSCTGDDFGGYDGEDPEWPCRTVQVIARRLGVEVSDGAWWAAWLNAGEQG